MIIIKINFNHKSKELKVGNVKIYGYIYKIINKINNKVYIGQTTVGFNYRYSGGEWWNKTHNDYLKRSVIKYGLENFELLEVYDIAFSKFELDTKEESYIKLYNSDDPNFGYNMTSGGANGKPNMETIQKNSGENHPLWGIKGEDNHWFGKKHSEETKNKMKKSAKGRVQSEETKLKISKNRKGRFCGENNPNYGNGDKISGKNHPKSKTVEIYDINFNLVITFNTIIETSEWLVENNICKDKESARKYPNYYAKNGKSYKGYYFKIISNNSINDK